MIITLNTENFETLKADPKPLVIDFWAVWCGPCRMVSPIIDELAEEYDGRINVAKCDVDQCEEIPAQFRVRNIPTIVFIKGGEVVAKQVGAASKADLKQKFEELL